MNFENFEESILNQFRNNSKNVVFDEKLIEYHFLDADIDYLKKFIDDFNTVLVEYKGNKYKSFEKFLMYGSMKGVLDKFRESDILIRACKTYNKKLLEWLFTMKINYNVRDQEGMTALMHAARNGSLGFAVDKLIEVGSDSLNMEDNYGNTALFHAVSKPENLKKLLSSDININHINKDRDNILLHCCRYDYMRSYDILNQYNCFDARFSNKYGKTVAMYLVENARYKELVEYLKKNEDKIGPNDKNKFGYGLVSSYMKSYYNRYIGIVTKNKGFSNEFLYPFAYTFSTLIELNCDFNVSVDEDDNTPIMIFLMMRDYVSAKYLLDNYNGTIDLSKKNKYGVNASYFSLFIDKNIFEKLEFNKILNNYILSYDDLKKTIYTNDTFDSQYRESDHDIVVHQNINYINKYPLVPKYSTFVRQWILEILYPNVGPAVVYPFNLN